MQEAIEEENQSYGWIMKREVRWNSVQVKLKQKMFVGLKKELREVKYEIRFHIVNLNKVLFLERMMKQKKRGQLRVS